MGYGAGRVSARGRGLGGSTRGRLADARLRAGHDAPNAADIIAEAERFGLDPADQPRAHILRAPLMRVQADGDLTSAAERAKSSYYALMRRVDASWCCMARVDQIDDLSVVITTLRQERAGHVDAADMARFAALLPHLRSAMRLQLRLEDHGARLAWA